MKGEITDHRWGGVPRFYTIAACPKDINLRILDDIQKCVVYLGELSKNNNEPEYGGTAFFVSVPMETVQGRSHVYLITADHNFAKIKSDDIYIRYNTRAGLAKELKTKRVEWKRPGNSIAQGTELKDVAALLINDKIQDGDFITIPSNMWATENIRKTNVVGVPDEVYMVGLFTKAQGNQKNIPIVRAGTISSVPDQKINSPYGWMDKTYLIEGRSVGGLSGSPLFVYKADFVSGGIIHKNFLLGLMHGHWDVLENKINEAKIHIPSEDEKGVNLGIAIVISVDEIRNFLYSEEIMKERKEIEGKIIKDEFLTTPDFK